MRLVGIWLILLHLAIQGLFAQNAEEQSFSDSLSAALKSRDQAALEALVSFDHLDAQWQTMARASLASLLQQVQSDQSFVVTISPVDPATLRLPNYQGSQMSYNLPIIKQAQITSPDTPELKNRTTNFYLGEKDGKLRIACLYSPSKPSGEVGPAADAQ